MVCDMTECRMGKMPWSICQQRSGNFPLPSCNLLVCVCVRACGGGEIHIDVFTVFTKGSLANCAPLYFHTAHSSGHIVYSVGLKLLDCWDQRFESFWGHRCSSQMSVVYTVNVTAFAMSCSLVQRSPTKCVCDLEAWTAMQPTTEFNYRATGRVALLVKR
jgi:hypothetical protein